MSTPDTPDLSPLEQVKKLASEILPDADLSRLATWARLEEPQRRKEAASARAAAASAALDVVQQVWNLQPDLKPRFADTAEGEVPAWVQPAGDLTSYPDGAHVEHQDRVWRNDLGTLNLSEPSEGPGWVDVTPVVADGTRTAPYPWEQGIDLAAGDYTTWDGQLYIATENLTAEQTPDQLIGQHYERIS